MLSVGILFPRREESATHAHFLVPNSPSNHSSRNLSTARRQNTVSLTGEAKIIVKVGQSDRNMLREL